MRMRPSKEKLSQSVTYVLSSRLKVESQEELTRLVLKNLKKENKNYSLSPFRVKRIALELPEIEVKAKTKKTIKLQKIESCPVCDERIEHVKVKNLANKTIPIGYKCTSCGYQSDLEAFMPMKYSFVFRH